MVMMQYWEWLGSFLKILLLIGIIEKFYSRVIKQKSFAPQSEQVLSKVQVRYLMNDCNGETKQEKILLENSNREDYSVNE